MPLSILVSRKCVDDMVQDREEAIKYEIDAGKARAASRTLARWLATASREAIQKPRDMRSLFGKTVVILSGVRRAEPTSPILGNMERRKHLLAELLAAQIERGPERRPEIFRFKYYDPDPFRLVVSSIRTLLCVSECREMVHPFLSTRYRTYLVSVSLTVVPKFATHMNIHISCVRN